MKIEISAFQREELSEALILEMENLVQEIDPSLSSDHLRKNHLPLPETTFYLARKGKNLVGIASYRTAWSQATENRKKVLVNVGGLFYRKKDPNLKQLVATICRLHIRKALGPFWMLKPFMAIGHTVNPKVYTSLERSFPCFYPRTQSPTPLKIRKLLQDFYQQLYNKDFDICPNLSLAEPESYTSETIISQTYQEAYRSRNEKVNQFFFDQGVFKKAKNELFLTNRSIIVMGYYSPKVLFKQILGKQVIMPALNT